MITERLLERVDQLIEMGNAALQTKYTKMNRFWVDPELAAHFRSASLSFIANLYGDKHPHFAQLSELKRLSGPGEVGVGMGILRAIRGEIDGGWLVTIKSLVTAEVFTDFLEMADYLLGSGYKDPAAVVTGSVLEEHLRQLCGKNGIPVTRQKDDKDIPLKADRLNSELAKADVYSRLDQKNVTAWLDLRNKAAHGKYSEYNADQVEQMMTAVTEFMARVAI